MKNQYVINWNTMSKLGLIARINAEILHPLGLAMTRCQGSGFSEFVLVADDGVYEYPEGYEIPDIGKSLRDIIISAEKFPYDYTTRQLAQKSSELPQ